MKPYKKFKFILELIGLKLLVFIVRLLPWNTAVKFGEFLGILLSKIIHKRFKRTVSDIQKAFPAKTQQEVYDIAIQSWSNIGRIATEFAKGTSLSKEELLKKVEFRNMEEIFKLNDEGKGCILHMGHFTNWELFGIAISLRFRDMAFVARPQTNPYVDKMINDMRTMNGNRMLVAYNPFFSTSKALKKGSAIGILSDQSVPSSKLYMNFMGRPAELGPMTAMLALKMRIPVYPVKLHRENGKLVIEGLPAVVVPQCEYSHEELYKLTERLKNIYEDWIRENPASWLWAHNRWKREKDCIKAMKEEAAAKAENKEPDHAL